MNIFSPKFQTLKSQLYIYNLKIIFNVVVSGFSKTVDRVLVFPVNENIYVKNICLLT